MQVTKEKPKAPIKYERFNIKDTTWWATKEMGSPDDPYNQIPKLTPNDREYDEYIEMAEQNFDTMLQEYENETGWVFLKEENGVRVEYKETPDDPIRCFRGSGIIHATPEVVRLHLVQIDLRPYWDAMFEGGHYKLEVCENVRVVYYSFKAPSSLVYNRDFYVVAGEKITEDNIVISAVNSVKREDCPEKEGYVRGFLKTSGFVIKPLENDDDGHPRCMVTYLAQVNPMGWIPSIVVNLVNVEQPMCINNIRNAIALTQVMIEECFTKLFALPEEKWKARDLKRLILKAIDNNNGKKDMLLDPFAYVLTGNRKNERAIEVLEELGKAGAMRKLWDGAAAYLPSIASKSLYEAAEKFFTE